MKFRNVPIKAIKGEIWKKIEGYEEYSVSNMGRIKRNRYFKELNKRKDYLISPCANKIGYYMISINSKSYPVHQLVAKAFLQDTYFEGAELDHIDDDKSNNKVSNLHYVTHAYNMHKDSVREKIRVKICRPVKCVETGEVFESVTAAAKAAGCNLDNLSKHMSGKNKTCKKKHYEYVSKG